MLYCLDSELFHPVDRIRSKKMFFEPEGNYHIMGLTGEDQQKNVGKYFVTDNTLERPFSQVLHKFQNSLEFIPFSLREEKG